MQSTWWIIGVALLIWGLRAEGLSATLWSIVAGALAIGLGVLLLVAMLNPTGAGIISTLLVAAGTWRLMWWLTDRGYI